MSSDIVLRDYSPRTDFDEIFSFCRDIISEPPYEDARAELERYPGHDLVAKVAVGVAGKPIGFCAATHPYWNNVAIIDYLAVASPARGRRIGHRLVVAVEGALHKLGIRHICVQTASWNKHAIRFYEELGYTRLALLPDYLGEGNDAVWLSRRLSSA
jgi:ribosomal protein S18 acetylase RimI-like enzyme